MVSKWIANKCVKFVEFQLTLYVTNSCIEMNWFKKHIEKLSFLIYGSGSLMINHLNDGRVIAMLHVWCQHFTNWLYSQMYNVAELNAELNADTM